ncbi:MAG: DegV family EDD domain-containing protein [Planctomycetaceae bacterium]|nr:DegV family EDD domain-containing protein [Planctomycetaceae bacterium]
MNSQSLLDQINVFPVPDGDTGANLVGTFRGIADIPVPQRVTRLDTVLNLLAESVLTEARGNSGAIMAEFACRLCDEWKSRVRINTREFASGLVVAASGAKSAVGQPREGTILTVLQRWADWIEEQAAFESDFEPLLLSSLMAARQFLRETTDQLDVLQEAGVVDAGALGFVRLLEGVCELIREGRVATVDTETSETPTIASHHHPIEVDSTYRYCTECLVTGKELSRSRLKGAIDGLGDSLIVSGAGTRARIHIHTDEPGAVFRVASQFGEVLRTKADDMVRQQESTRRGDRIAIVTDSACDLPAKVFDDDNIHVVPLRLRIGSEDHIARMTLSTSDFYRMLDEESAESPKTSQPSPADFQRIYEFVAHHHEAVISIHLSGGVSGTFHMAQRIARSVSERIHVIDSRSASVGLGFLVEQAARWAEKSVPATDIVKRLHAAVAQVQSLFCVERLDYLIRGGRVSRAKGIVGKLLGMKPIFQYDETGTPQLVGKALRGQSVHEVLLQKVLTLARSMPTVRLGIAHAEDPDRAHWYAERLASTIEPASILVTELSPVIAIHGGRGTIGITMIPSEISNP